MTPFGTGAHESHYDPRTIVHDTTKAFPPTTGGIIYAPSDIENQRRVGICTAADLVQNVQKVRGRKFSIDFQYLLQKKYYDLDWYEGSSIFSSLKVGKRFGFLPLELFLDGQGKPYVTEEDRDLPYNQYIAKLQQISDPEVQRLLNLCVYPLAGYAQIPTDIGSLAQAITDSKAGILTRYVIGSEWYTALNGQSSWNPIDIDPLRPPQSPISGHAIGTSAFDLITSQGQLLTHPNTWSTMWNLQGNGHTNHLKYPCTEAWIPYYDTVPTPAPAEYVFTQDMYYTETSEDVKQLQMRLIKLGFSIPAGATGYYGKQTKEAVFEYQLKNIPLSWYEKYVAKGFSCGPKTREALNRSLSSN